MKQLLQQFLYNEHEPLLFNNGFFVFFFTVFIVLYYIFQNNYKVRTWLFCFFSLYFFYKASGAFVFLVIASAVVDYFIANLIFQVPSKSTKKVLLWIGILFNLSILIYFKYTNFLIDLFNQITYKNISSLNIVLPVAISFYTFESISYIVDVYNRKTMPAKRFADYLLFLSFFPKLVMGPIVRASDFLPQISKPYFVSQKDFSAGFMLIVTGLIKKLIISDYISANFVNYIFDEPQRYTGIECLLATYGFAIVIYCDFSGYTNIAIGLAKWLGFNIPPNFNKPYTATNITEFWQRWHISLSTWLKDYVYIPLGGNKKGTINRYKNLIITMLIGGLWHGANITFIIWGAMHGVALAVHKLFFSKSKNVFKAFYNSKIYIAFTTFITFNFVCISWIFFRSSTVTQARIMFKQMKFNFSINSLVLIGQHYASVLIMMLAGLLIHFSPEIVKQKTLNALQKEGLLGYILLFCMFLVLYAIFKTSTAIMPIYLQF